MAEIIRYDFGAAPPADPPATGGRAPAIAALNLSPRPGDVEGNLRLAGRAVAAAKREHPETEWVVLPELFTCGYSDLERVQRFAEDAVGGPSARFFAALAADLGLHVAYGFPEGSSGLDGVYDSANLVGPDGVLATYRKRNLVGTTPERRVFVPGTELPVVGAGGARVALAVCWDLGFPEVAREAASSGAELILAPAAWREPWGAQYGLSCAARALDNGVFLASANQIGRYPEARFASAGHLYGPDGVRLSRPVACAHGRRSVGALDLGAVARWRVYYGSTLQPGVADPLGSPLGGTHPRGPGVERVEVCS